MKKMTSEEMRQVNGGSVLWVVGGITWWAVRRAFCGSWFGRC